MKKKLFVGIYIFLGIQAHDYSNLQRHVQDFVIQTKRIQIPEFPDAFNPSIIQWQNKLLLSFRTRNNTDHATYVGFVWLNKKFEPISTPKLLQCYNPTIICQDPRLLILHDELYIAYNDLVSFGRFASRRMFWAKVYIEDDEFILKDAQPLRGPWDAKKDTIIEIDTLKIRQKNWVPFIYNDTLYFSYSLVPHVIVPLSETGDFNPEYSSQNAVDWSLGQLRGGTPAIKLKDRYIAFFHSCKIMATQNSNGNKMRHYFMGAYTFKAEPPFEITHISPEPIVGKGFYEGKMDYKTWTSLRVVFPMGCIVGKKFIWVTYGRQDFESWVIQFNKKKLLQSLVPCN